VTGGDREIGMAELALADQQRVRYKTALVLIARSVCLLLPNPQPGGLSWQLDSAAEVGGNTA
jgi:hypothetical protein